MKNNRGSSLVFVLVILVVFSIVVATALAASAAVHKRSLNNADKKQAYFTARSCADVIAAEIINGKIKLSANNSITIDDFSLPSEMGKASVTVSMDFSEKEITIVSSGTKNEKKESLSLKLKYVILTNEDSENNIPETGRWKKIGYATEVS